MAAMSAEQSNWRSNLLWALIGALIGVVLQALTETPLQWAKDTAVSWSHPGYETQQQGSLHPTGGACPKGK